MYTGIIKPDESESYVDLGAYDGDTIRELLSFTNGRFKAITALEPDAKNYKKLVQKLPLAVKEEDADRVALYNMGAWNREEVQTFAVRAGRNSSLAKKGVEVQMNSVDNLLCGEKATIIKLDVEGAEYNALLGCEKTIKAYKPKLMISSYHRNEDLFALPLLVNKICPEYRFYLRHHPYIPAWETNYYAVAND